MASNKTLNAKNLSALGADRLATLMLELVAGNATAKRLLRLELASHSSGGDVAAEIRKRLATIAKSKSFVDWHKVRAFATDLDMQRSAIVKHVTPGAPGEAFDLFWSLLDLAPRIYDRCDDSNGTIGAIFRQTLADLGAIAPQARPDVTKLANRVEAAILANDYGQFDDIIPLMAPALGREGLALLKTRLEKLAATAGKKPKVGDRKVIAISTRGPVHLEDFETRYHNRRLQSALTDIADALGDVDGYAARYSAEERTNPYIAANIAQRLLEAQRPEEAMAALRLADANTQGQGRWPDWQRVYVDTLDALGRADEAQSARWAIFERNLDPDYLRAHLKRLPDFDDEEAKDRALEHVRHHDDVHQALHFLIHWPALSLAADMVLARHDQLDGDLYDLLTLSAEALEQHSPLAATLILRAMIDVSLDRAKSRRYGHAARHLQTCLYLSKRIDDFGGHRDHAAYLADLKARHGRKSAFWNAV